MYSQIMAQIVRDRLEIAQDISQDSESPLNYTALATQTEGYSAMDLQDLVARAIHQVAMRSADTNKPVCSSSSSYLKLLISMKVLLTSEDFVAAQVDFVPLSLRDIKLQKSDVAWSDIGGTTRPVLCAVFHDGSDTIPVRFA